MGTTEQSYIILEDRSPHFLHTTAIKEQNIT